jgi:hypothetical protein
MMSAVTTPRLGREFDRFLYASVGDDNNGMPLTVLSALARMDIDPWEEASKLTQLPPESAVMQLASLLGALRNASVAGRDPVRIAAPLIALLPCPRRQPLRSIRRARWQRVRGRKPPSSECRTRTACACAEQRLLVPQVRPLSRTDTSRDLTKRFLFQAHCYFVRSVLRLLSITSFGFVGLSGSFLKLPGVEAEIVSHSRSRAAFGSGPGGVALPLRGGLLDDEELAMSDLRNDDGSTLLAGAARCQYQRPSFAVGTR